MRLSILLSGLLLSLLTSCAMITMKPLPTEDKILFKTAALESELKTRELAIVKGVDVTNYFNINTFDDKELDLVYGKAVYWGLWPMSKKFKIKHADGSSLECEISSHNAETYSFIGDLINKTKE